ncbi:MAG: hypothetical protein ABI743_06995 [bacterium]
MTHATSYYRAPAGFAILLCLSMGPAGPCRRQPPREDFSSAIMSIGWDIAWVVPVGIEPVGVAEGLNSPFVRCWPMDEAGVPLHVDYVDTPAGKPTMHLRLSKSIKGTIDTTVQQRDLTATDVGMVLLAPFQYHLTWAHCTGSLADVMESEHLGVVGDSAAALIELYGPITYYRDATGQVVDVVFTFAGEPVRLRSNSDDIDAPLVLDAKGDSTTQRWEQLDPAAFPHSFPTNPGQP